MKKVKSVLFIQKFFLSIALVFLIPGTITPDDFSKADSLLRKIKAAGSKTEKMRLTDELIGPVYTSEHNEAKKLAEYLLLKTMGPGLEMTRGYLLIHVYRFNNFPKSVSDLNSAQRIAVETGDEDLLGAVYTFKTVVYRDNSIYDSAMTYALLARDLYEKNEKTVDLLTNLQMIGDMHYYAGEYEEAEKMYHEVQKGLPNLYNSFNYRILMNNLGLIRVKQKRYEEAESYFLKSVQHLKRPGSTYPDSASLPYIFRKLMEVNILQNEFDQAEFYFNAGVGFTDYYGGHSELTGYHSGKARILINRNQFDSALIQLKLAEENEKRFPDISFRSEIYKLYGAVFKALGKFKDATYYLENYTITEKTIDSLKNRAKLLHLYARHNFIIAVNQSLSYKNERNLFIIISALVLTGLIVTSLFFIRMRKAFRLLVEKNLRLAYTPDSNIKTLIEPSVKETKVEVHTISERDEGERRQSEPGDEIVSRIIEDLEILINNEKIYLDTNLTLLSLAEKLSTNRTYLAKAIYKKYNVNFLEFINRHRIRESIKIMNSDEGKIHSLEGIASLSGFSNRVTFSKVFKDSTGVSPGYFMRNLQSFQR